MPSVRCFGVCGGVKGWLDSRTNLCCTLCQGSGVYTTPPTFGEQCAAIAAKGRLSHSAIVAGDVDARGKGKVRKRWKQRRPRMTKAKRLAIARDARRKAETQDFQAFKATRPPDWEKQLDELKAGFRK